MNPPANSISHQSFPAILELVATHGPPPWKCVWVAPLPVGGSQSPALSLPWDFANAAAQGM